MWKGIVAAATLVVGAGTASAATWTAIYTGTVTTGHDETGMFIGKGSHFGDINNDGINNDGQAFRLVFTYDPSVGERYEDVVVEPGLYHLEYHDLSGGDIYDEPSPLLSAVLTIAGKSYSFLQSTYGSVLSYALKNPDENLLGPELNYFAIRTEDYSRTYDPVSNLETTRDYFVSARFFSSLLSPDFTTAFSTDLDDTDFKWSGSFGFTDCVYDPVDDASSCSRSTRGSFSVASLTVGPATAAVPLPASAWLLLAALGGMGAVARRKRLTA